MPYVEGFGTWPFGEEWLWEAMATSYAPLADVLDAHPGRVTLSLTPVLADQLAAPGVAERYLAFLRDVREASHALDFEAHPEVAAAARALAGALPAGGGARGDLLDRLAPHVSWTSSATHAILPLLATEAGIELQVRTGVGVAPRALRRGTPRASGCPSARTRRGCCRTSRAWPASSCPTPDPRDAAARARRPRCSRRSTAR